MKLSLYRIGRRRQVRRLIRSDCRGIGLPAFAGAFGRPGRALFPPCRNSIADRGGKIPKILETLSKRFMNNPPGTV